MFPLGSTMFVLLKKSSAPEWRRECLLDRVFCSTNRSMTLSITRLPRIAVPRADQNRSLLWLMHRDCVPPWKCNPDQILLLIGSRGWPVFAVRMSAVVIFGELRGFH